MYKIVFAIILVSLTFSNNLFARDKFEKESRIRKRDVPVKATDFMDSLNLGVRIKWFREEGLNRNSFEAKFKHNNRKYSIEFDTSGNIEDVEIEVKLNNLESYTIDSVSAQLALDCLKYKIVKVQIQFTGSKFELLSLIKTGVKSDQILTNYEIVVRCKQQNNVELFEYLFDDKVQLINKSKIVYKNSSHLEY